MNKQILQTLIERKETGVKSFAVLIDPDNFNNQNSTRIVHACIENKVDYIFVGGSLLKTDNISDVVHFLKDNCAIPVVIFPGNSMQVETSADALLFLSLISGRNPELLIGQHVVAAPILKKSGIEILPTGYIIIDSGKTTTATYISQTIPVPRDKPSVASATAMAGEMLGLKIIYLEAGSGAESPVPTCMIDEVSGSVEIPLIVGGGINTGTKAIQALEAGADMIVIGNGVEENINLLTEVSEMIEEVNTLP